MGPEGVMLRVEVTGSLDIAATGPLSEILRWITIGIMMMIQPGRMS